MHEELSYTGVLVGVQESLSFLGLTLAEGTLHSARGQARAL